MPVVHTEFCFKKNAWNYKTLFKRETAVPAFHYLVNGPCIPKKGTGNESYSQSCLEPLSQLMCKYLLWFNTGYYEPGA